LRQDIAIECEIGGIDPETAAAKRDDLSSALWHVSNLHVKVK
jgi:hypothetical protein